VTTKQQRRAVARRVEIANEALSDLVYVGHEPLTYERHKQASFFQDLATARYRNFGPAMERLDRHRAEMDVELRINPRAVLGTGGEFTPPLWLIGDVSFPARAGRVLGDLIPNFELPAGFSSVHMPKITTGADAGIQPLEGDPVVNVDEVTADVSSPVVTIAGDADASQQLLDLTPPPGYDAIVYGDLSRAYNANLEAQLISGTGTNGQLTGLTNVSGISTITYTDASPTFAEMWPMIGESLAAIGNNRKLPAEVILMAPRRWAWIASSLDSSLRPIVSPGNAGPHGPDYPMAGGTWPVGPIAGRPVYEDGAIPAGSSADLIISCRPSDMVLFESVPHFSVLTNPTSGTLGVRLQLRRYVACNVQKPTAISVVTGTGLAAPNGYS